MDAPRLAVTAICYPPCRTAKTAPERNKVDRKGTDTFFIAPEHNRDMPRNWLMECNLRSGAPNRS